MYPPRGVRSGLVTATCTPLHLGTSSATYEIVITDERDRRTCAIPPARRRRGK